MQKIDYLENKTNELLSKLSYTSERLTALENKVNNELLTQIGAINERLTALEGSGNNDSTQDNEGETNTWFFVEN